MLTANALALLFVICSPNFVAGEVCYICGSNKERITNPNSKVPIPNKYGSSYTEVDCETLALAGMSGAIPDDACVDLHESSDFKEFCGCRTSNSETYDVPIGFPVMEATPTFLHRTYKPSAGEETDKPSFSVPERAPINTDRPNSIVYTDTEKPEPHISPTTSTADVQSSNEQTELPSTAERINDGDRDDIQSVQPSNQPSTHPSDVPSRVPSSVPSDVPSDVPSAQPTVDIDISGVVVESSANIAPFLSMTQALPMAVLIGYLFGHLP